jgi:sugar/nucleoside kinase (ribokinase family)
MEKQTILERTGSRILTVPGGAAANTIMAAAELGVASAMLGKIGNDPDGDFFVQALRNSGASEKCLLVSPDRPTGYCLTLVTPDAERTMRSNLGASLDLAETDAANVDFSGFDWVLLEGYFVNTDFFEAVLKYAHAAKCKIAVDLCSYELAEKFRERFSRLLKEYADLLFANLEEASALTGTSDLNAIAGKLAALTDIAVIKRGASGSLIIAGENQIHVPPAPVKRAVDTTAAGDYYAAGFFYGLMRKLPLAKCGYAGSLTSAAIVQHPGTKLTEHQWNQLKHILEQECK